MVGVNLFGKTMSQFCINEPYFRVELDHDATSPNPEVAIWRGQHTCVSELFAFDEPVPSNPGEIVVKHQMKPKHFSVLRKAYISFCCTGFPHSVIAQITRHQDSSFLVQSNRFTGRRFVELGLKKTPAQEDIEAVFYFRPIGEYRDRTGSRFIYTEIERKQDLNLAWLSCTDYADKINRGCPYEMARGSIPYDFRQSFDISGDLQAVFHWLDQRSLADSQLEIQILAEMVMQRLEKWCPTIAKWYRENRWGKNLLAP